MIIEKNTKVYAVSFYDFKANSSLLCVEDNTTAFSDFFMKKKLSVSSVSIRKSASDKYVEDKEGFFDYIIAVDILEKCFMPELVLKQWNRMLKPDGVLLLATPNRLGIQFFCGDRDPITQNVFDGIEGYQKFSDPSPKNLGGRLYSRDEIQTMLRNAGFNEQKFYSVYPNLDVPQLLYADDFLPNEDLNLRIIPRYNSPNSIFMDGRHLYNSLVKNGLFHALANAFLVECPKTGVFSPVNHVTLPVFRDEESFITIIRNDNVVEKRIVDISGALKLQKMQDYSADLKKHGISMINMKIQENSLVMPFIKAPSAVYYLRDLLVQDKEKFIIMMDRFKELIERSSEHIDTPDGEIILKHGYIDLVPINAFYIDGDFMFYDQEFYYENLPAKVIIWRTILFIYDENRDYEKILPMQFFFDRYKIHDIENIVKKYILPFMDNLLNKKDFAEFNKETEQKCDRIYYNYNRINNAFADEKKLLENCFDDIDQKKVYVFGSGKYADKFLAFYKDDFNIAGVLDNSSQKQGTSIRGFSVCSPELLSELNPDDYKVIICISKYVPVYEQLNGMGVKNIGLYSSNYLYPGRQSLFLSSGKINESNQEKKYRVGYIAGVFDLYHLGHLNMFRRAKELCDYLVVGVTSDRYVRELKKKEPFIPFEERLEMVRSCRYVDEAHELPFEYSSSIEAFQKYHFDVQFSGSDYVNHPWWLEQQKWLREHGADLVFFPYTQQTSSTKIKALIEKGLL